LSEQKSYYVVDPEAVKAVLNHEKKWAKVSQKKEGSEDWKPTGYIGWSKSGKSLTIMVATNP
jgi:hypothetical protein